MNSCPASCPRKNSIRMSPKSPRIEGRRKGLTRLIRNILLRGSASFVNSIAPWSPGPHHRLCLPNENCQLARFIPTYASSSRTRLMALIGMRGGFGGRASAVVMKLSAAGDNDGADGLDWYSLRAYITNGPTVAQPEVPTMLLKPS